MSEQTPEYAEVVPVLVARLLRDNLDHCELVGLTGSGRCTMRAVAARFDGLFVDLVCAEHAERSTPRTGTTVIFPPASMKPVHYHERVYVHPSGERRGYLCCCPEGKPHEVPVNDEWLTEEESDDA